MLKGHIGRIDPHGVAGWAADTESPDLVVDVLIYVDGKRVAKIACDRFREDLRALKIYGDGHHGFTHAFVEPLPPKFIDNVTVRFAQTGHILPNGEAHLSQRHDLGAIMITAPGRSGTTLMMSHLARSPQVCVAETPPFEVRHISYWATVASTLTSPADYDRSTHPDHLEGDGFKVGSNPFSQNSFADAFRSKELAAEYFGSYSVAQLHELARKMIVEYYLRLMDDQPKLNATLFAEKCNNLHRPTRMFARQIFPNLKEILLIRDPRDLLCSQLSYFRQTTDRLIPDITHAVRQIMGILADESTLVKTIKYEELIQNPETTLAGLARWLEIDLEPHSARSADVFKAHGTSGSPEASIGRWKADLPPELREKCSSAWHDFLESFSYAT
jgi:hypothetical protein